MASIVFRLQLLLALALSGLAICYGGGGDDEPAEIAGAPSDEVACAAHSDGSPYDALVWRIGGMFGIMVASCIGFAVPLLFRHPKHTTWLFLFRAFAAGVVLATGMVHVLPEATEVLEDPCLGLPEDFPFTSVFATFAALLAFTGEYLIREALLKHSKSAMALMSSGEVALGDSKAQAGDCKECAECPAECSDCVVDCKECEGGCAECPEECTDCQTGVPVCTDCEGEAGAAPAPHKAVGGTCELTELVKPKAQCAAPLPKAVEIHAAPCVAGAADCVECVSPVLKDSGRRAKGAALVAEGATESVESIMGYRAAALTLEAGIIFHSLFIGITLGTSQDLAFVQGLAIALCFHQGFEGISLGSCLVKARLGLLKVAILGIVFVLTTPVGVAIGLGLGSAYNPNSAVALGIDGAFGAASAGILIYVGLVDLVHPTFDKCDPATPKNKIVLGMGFLSMFLGAFCMSLLALWA